MNAESSVGKTHFGNLTTFYSLLYTSAAVFFIGLTLIFTDSPEIGLIFIFFASILMIISFVLFCIIFYRVWKFIIAKERRRKMVVITTGSFPLVSFMEVGNRYKKRLESPDIPDYMKPIGTWGFPVEEKWHFIQVFEVDESKEADALDRQNAVFLKNFVDIPGFAFTTQIAYGVEPFLKLLE